MTTKVLKVLNKQFPSRMEIVSAKSSTLHRKMKSGKNSSMSITRLGTSSDEIRSSVTNSQDFLGPSMSQPNTLKKYTSAPVLSSVRVSTVGFNPFRSVPPSVESSNGAGVHSRWKSTPILNGATRDDSAESLVTDNALQVIEKLRLSEKELERDSDFTLSGVLPVRTVVNSSGSRARSSLCESFSACDLLDSEDEIELNESESSQNKLPIQRRKSFTTDAFDVASRHARQWSVKTDDGCWMSSKFETSYEKETFSTEFCGVDHVVLKSGAQTPIRSRTNSISSQFSITGSLIRSGIVSANRRVSLFAPKDHQLRHRPDHPLPARVPILKDNLFTLPWGSAEARLLFWVLDDHYLSVYDSHVMHQQGLDPLAFVPVVELVSIEPAVIDETRIEIRTYVDRFTLQHDSIEIWLHALRLVRIEALQRHWRAQTSETVQDHHAYKIVEDREIILRDQKRFSEEYRLDRILGSGSYASVRFAYHVPSGDAVVIKLIDRKLVHRRSMNGVLPYEIDILKRLPPHPNIIQVRDYLQLTDSIALVTDYFGHGEDIFSYLEREHRLDESKVRVIFKQVVDAVSFLASLGYTHNDIKDENIVIDSDTLSIKLIDFGSAAPFRPGEKAFRFFGTDRVSSPEVVRCEAFSPLAQEVWSLGILLYVLSYGEDAYLSADAVPTTSGSPLPVASIEAQQHVSVFSAAWYNLLESMLCVDCEERATMDHIKNHPWLQMS